jgi:hypothetical protein
MDLATANRKIHLRKLLKVKELFNYSKQGRLKVLRHRNSIDRLVRSQITRYLAADLDNPSLSNGSNNIINWNLLHILKSMGKQYSPMEIQTKMNLELIQQLLDCALVCEQCTLSCLREPGIDKMRHCIQLGRDCADLCFNAIKHVARASSAASGLLASCEAICRKCAGECRKHDMDHCQTCADACEQCAEACHEHHGKFQLL